MGWGFKKSAAYANQAADDANTTITRSASTVDRRAKDQGWVKAPVAVVTADERRAQTAPARKAKHERWVERSITAANEQAEVVFSALDELDDYFDTSSQDRITMTAKNKSTRYSDGSAQALRTAIEAATAIDKADKHLEGTGVLSESEEDRVATASTLSPETASLLAPILALIKEDPCAA